MKKIWLVGALIFISIPPGPVWPQTKDGPPQKLETMVVRDKSCKEAPDSPYRLPESNRAGVWTIDQQRIQALVPKNLFDILSYAPGIQMSFQGRKGMNFMGSRGSGNFVGGGSFAVLIDGVYVPWTQSSRVLTGFPVETIASVQVVRDSSTLTLAPAGVLGFRGSAGQGVIIIKTVKPSEKRIRAKAGYGNLNRYKGFLNYGDSSDAAYYSLSYSKQHDDGRTGWNNGSDSDAILLKGGYESGGITAEASFYHDWASREIQRADPVSRVSDAKWEYDPLNTLMAAANVAKKWTASQTTSLGLYSGRVDATLNLRSYSKPVSSENEQEDNVYQADLRHIVVTDRHNFRIGGQAIFWESPTGQFYYEGSERKEELYCAYAHDEYTLNPAMSVDAGVRVEHRHISKGINKYSPNETTPTDIVEDEWVEPYYSAAVGTAYRFNAGWQASFRVNYTEQGTDDFLVSADNRPLDAERQWRYEAGLIAGLNPAIQMTATAFYYNISNLKQTVGSVTVGEEIINVYSTTDTARKGVEVEVSGYLFSPVVNYGLSYTYQRSETVSDDDAVPHHMAALQLGYHPMPFQCNMMLRHVSQYDSNQFTVDNAYYPIGDYTCLDANLSYDFTVRDSRVRATVFGRNLTDEQYQTRLGWKDVGLTYGVELDIKF